RSLAALSLVYARGAGIRHNGAVIEPTHPGWGDLRAAAEAARLRPSAWLEQRDICGTLVEEPGFAEALEEWLGVTWSEGAATALGQNLRDG
ncbi:MAG: mannitol dehydrogenase family protein, partial [Boseongicola sp.]|nr:mannitol dehydrogenase family protein [Boseongicola sp.]